METSTPHFSFKQLLGRMHLGTGKSMTPDLLWQIILGGGLIGITVVMTFAYTTYNWAMNSDLSNKPTRAQREVLSIAELEGVIAVYQNKEAEFERLLKDPPQAPEYRKGKGIAETSSSPMR